MSGGTLGDTPTSRWSPAQSEVRRATPRRLSSEEPSTSLVRALLPVLGLVPILHAVENALVVDDLDKLAVDVESADYDVAGLKSRRRGRPAIGTGPAEVVPVRIDPELRAAMDARAEADHTTTSEFIREALRRYLDVA